MMTLLNNKIRRVCLVGLLLIGSVPAMAQIGSMEADFAASVKSVNEFLARFNGEEQKPGVTDEGESRRNNLLALFDFKMDYSGMPATEFEAMLDNFVTTVEQWPGTLRLADANAWAELTCTFTYQKKKVPLTLVMHQEMINNEEKRWTIAGVRGLEQAGIYTTGGHSVISPVDHELHFMGLANVLENNRTLIPQLRPQSRQIDELSMFLGLAMSGALKLVDVDKMRVHFADVPGFIFTIEEVIRDGNNSGWLITRLERATDAQKAQFFNNLFGFINTEEEE